MRGAKLDNPRPALEQGPGGNDDILDVRFLFKGIWRGKWIVIVFAIIGVLLGYRSLVNFSPSYLATMVVVPSGQEFGQTSGRVSGLAQSFGIEISGGEQASSFDRFRLLMSSLELAQVLQEKYGLFDQVFGPARDSETGEWKRPQGFRFETEQKIRGLLNLQVWEPPTMESLAGFLRGTVVVDSTKEGAAFKRISVANQDPDFALFLLEVVYREADALVRTQDRVESEARRRYLESQLLGATIAESRAMLTGLLASEERRLMLMSGELPYSMRILQMPHVSSSPTSATLGGEFVFPVIAATGVGILLVLLFAVARRD